MAIVQAIVAFVGRSFGKILSALFDWAVVAIFGYSSGTEKIFLSGLLAAAGAWPVLLLGIAFPKIATFILAFVPLPSSVPSWVVRVVWIALAVLVPLSVGVAMAARQPPDRPRRGWPARLLKGFPITIGLSAALLITMVTVPVLRLVSAVRGRKDVQVPLLTDQKSYVAVARRIPVVMEDHGRPVRRTVPLLFTTVHGNPFTDRTWSAEWVKWRRAAGWPEEHGGFHALRHFFATTLITNHADPKEVQRALRHSTLQITLETYVRFWPRRERRRGVVGEVLKSAAAGRWDLT